MKIPGLDGQAQHGGYLQTAAAMLVLYGCRDATTRAQDPGDGETENSLREATFFSLFGNSKIVPSFQIS